MTQQGPLSGKAGVDSIIVMPFAAEGTTIEDTITRFGSEVWPAVQAAEGQARMSFELHRPATSLEEAISLAGRLAPDARFIAGGTDLVIQMSRRRVSASHVIALPQLPELQGVTQTVKGYRIGALTTYRSIERYPAFRGALDCLIEAARVVGGQQVRNIATVGGNIANASPAADFVPALLCLDAMLEIIGLQGTRPSAIERFDPRAGHCRFGAGEILHRNRIPPASRNARRRPS